jgi:hypothetical protein
MKVNPLSHRYTEWQFSAMADTEKELEAARDTLAPYVAEVRIVPRKGKFIMEFRRLIPPPTRRS